MPTSKAEEKLMKVGAIAAKYSKLWHGIADELAECEGDACERVSITLLCGMVLGVRSQLLSMETLTKTLIQNLPEMRKRYRIEEMKELYAILSMVVPDEGGKPN